MCLWLGSVAGKHYSSHSLNSTVELSESDSNFPKSVELSECRVKWFFCTQFFSMSRSQEPTKNTVFKRRRPNFDFCTAPYVWKYVSETSLMHFSMEMNKKTWNFSACGGLIWESVELSECRVKWIFYTFQNPQSVELSECRVKWVTTVLFFGWPIWEISKNIWLVWYRVSTTTCDICETGVHSERGKSWLHHWIFVVYFRQKRVLSCSMESTDSTRCVSGSVFFITFPRMGFFSPQKIA